MVLGKLPVPGVLLIWIRVGQGPTALAVGADGVVWTFFLSSIISLFFLPLSGRRPDIDLNTVELQWLEHLWDFENLFETGVVRAIEGLF